MGSNSGKDIWREEYRVVGNCQDGAAVRAGSSAVCRQGRIGNISQLAHPFCSPRESISSFPTSELAWRWKRPSGSGDPCHVSTFLAPSALL